MARRGSREVSEDVVRGQLALDDEHIRRHRPQRACGNGPSSRCGETAKRLRDFRSHIFASHVAYHHYQQILLREPASVPGGELIALNRSHRLWIAPGTGAVRMTGVERAVRQE